MNGTLRIALVIFSGGFVACGDSEVDESIVELKQQALRHRGQITSTFGGGNYLFADTFDISTAFGALALPSGRVLGVFRQSLDLNGELVSFRGRVTCLAVDSANGRAWIGGVVTRNDSEAAGFQTEIHQPGKDVWFRVLDTGRGPSVPADRSTFLGFEGGGGIITSQEYCETKPWPADNDRTHPFTEGGVRVRPLGD